MQITFSSISQSYDGQQLFDNLQLNIPSGALFTLLGPSGCGKTTLLRMLAGFVRPDKGKIKFGDQDVTDIAVHRRNVGMVFQDYALFPDRNVLANVSYGLLARGYSKESARKESLVMLERVGLTEFAQRMPADLSGGQRQRVAMARALVIKPRLLLLDEPLSALDVKLRIELREMIRTLQKEAGLTTLFVTHDQEEALAISDYVAVMQKGSVVQVGTPREIYNKPQTAFVADFVGGANLIPLQKELPSRVSNERRFFCGAGVVRTTSSIPWSAGLKLLIRPEKLKFVQTDIEQDGVLKGQIVSVDYLGAMIRYCIRTQCADLWLSTWSHTDSAMRLVNETVYVAVHNDAVIVCES